MVKEEALKKRAKYSRWVIIDSKDLVGPNDVELSAPPTHLLKLRIRNTTKYLNWRLSILKRDNFACRICHASIKENKNLRLEVHHPKSFDDICTENSVSTIEQALECKELWDVNNGISGGRVIFVLVSCFCCITKLSLQIRQ